MHLITQTKWLTQFQKITPSYCKKKKEINHVGKSNVFGKLKFMFHIVTTRH
jgi:hypothetical protein